MTETKQERAYEIRIYPYGKIEAEARKKEGKWKARATATVNGNIMHVDLEYSDTNEVVALRKVIEKMESLIAKIHID
jgi:hypothetical protein